MRARSFLVGAVAVVALAAFAPSAMAAKFTTGGSYSGSSPAKHTFVISGATVQCNAAFTGTVGTNATTAAFAPNYTSCAVNAAGTLLPATVSCANYTLNIGPGTYSSSTGKVSDSAASPVTIALGSAGCTITVTNTSCVIKATGSRTYRLNTDGATGAGGGNTPAGAGPYTGTTIAAKTGAVIAYTSTGCSQFSIPASGTNGSYTGTVNSSSAIRVGA